MIKAIETVYKGYRFRSRLEARWAVFFDMLGIEWVYEQEGFEMEDGTRYLPDFYLPTFEKGMYAEVKPEHGDFRKAIKFAEEGKLRMWCCEGTPEIFAYAYYDYTDGEGFCRGIPNADQAQGEDRMFAFPGYDNPDGSIDEKNYDAVGDFYIDAVKAARSARFGD